MSWLVFYRINIISETLSINRHIRVYVMLSSRPLHFFFFLIFPHFIINIYFILSNKNQGHPPRVSVLVANLLLHLGVCQCLQEWTPGVSLVLIPDSHLHGRQGRLTARSRSPWSRLKVTQVKHVKVKCQKRNWAFYEIMGVK